MGKKRGPDEPAAPTSTQFLAGIKVFVPDSSSQIPFLAAKTKCWLKQVPRFGGELTQDSTTDCITHALVGTSGAAALPPRLQRLVGQAAGGASALPPATPLPAAAAAAPATAAAADASTAAGLIPHAGSAQPCGDNAAGTAKRAKLPPQPPAAAVHLVHYRWLEQSLERRRVLPEAGFPPPLGPSSSGAFEPASGGGASAAAEAGGGGFEAARYRRWLGPELWWPECADMSSVELMLQAKYSDERCRRVSPVNLRVARALREMAKYERAVHDDLYDMRDKGLEPPETNARVRARSTGWNYQCEELRYTRAAAAVKACAYPLTRSVQGGDLPFVGAATAALIRDLVATGTCARLEDFRANRAVTDSEGRLRPGTAGARSRALFRELPGVGTTTAKRWWEMGLRTLEDVQRATQPGGPLAPGAQGAPSKHLLYALRHHRDLVEGTVGDEYEEMKAAVAAGLEAVSAPGWRVEPVGGGARSLASHDADLLCTHPSVLVDGVVRRLAAWLIQQGRMVPPEEGMCAVHSRSWDERQLLLQEALHKGLTSSGAQVFIDRADNIFGIFITSAGRRRRLDIVVVQPEEMPYMLVGWIGSRQFLRFRHQLVHERGMDSCQGRLVRRVDGRWRVVPDEAPPLDPEGRERWPLGWQLGRRVETQQDLFELLGLPYREPADRDCP